MSTIVDAPKLEFTVDGITFEPMNKNDDRVFGKITFKNEEHYGEVKWDDRGKITLIFPEEVDEFVTPKFIDRLNVYYYINEDKELYLEDEQILECETLMEMASISPKSLFKKVKKILEAKYKTNKKDLKDDEFVRLFKEACGLVVQKDEPEAEPIKESGEEPIQEANETRITDFGVKDEAEFINKYAEKLDDLVKSSKAGKYRGFYFDKSIPGLVVVGSERVVVAKFNTSNKFNPKFEEMKSFKIH